MDRMYRLDCRIAALVFALITLYTLPSKLWQGRLADDWLHTILHLGSGLVGANADRFARGLTPARVFTWGVAALYLALSVPALAIAAVDARRVRRP